MMAHDIEPNVVACYKSQYPDHLDPCSSFFTHCCPAATQAVHDWVTMGDTFTREEGARLHSLRILCDLGVKGDSTMRTFSASVLLLVIAVIIFALATFGVSIAGLNLVALGLAFFAASFVVVP